MCEFCGDVNSSLYGRIHGLELCSRHLQQYRIHGELKDYTKIDPNTYEVLEDNVTVKVHFRDNNGVIIGNCLVDADDWEYLKEYKWSATPESHKSSSYVVARGNRRMHRLVMKALKGEIVDHINGDTLDNRKSNLRIVTEQESGFNIGIQKNNTSGYPGVKRTPNGKKWMASIGYKNKNIYLGRFLTKEDAIKARKEAEKKYFKEFRRYK